MVLAMDGVAPAAVRAMQAFISAGQWKDERLLHQHWKEVDTDLGAADGVLMVDGSDCPKQGIHSMGVKRQYGGELGQRANCQAGVFVGDVSPQGYTLLDRRLSVPAAWLTDDAYAERRRQCGLPPETTFKTKPAVAQEMIPAVVKSQALRCRWVVADEAFGNTPGFLEGGAGLGLWYVAEVPHSTRVWEERPVTHIPPWRGRGRRPPRERLVAGASSGADRAEGGGGAAGRGVDTPDDQGRQPGAAGGGVLPPGGWSPCGTPCRGLMSGWCGVGTWRRGR